MQINLDMAQIAQEQMGIIQMCKEHEKCEDCPMKESGYIQTEISKWSCENASKV